MKKAFTIIELLVAISVIVIVLAGSGYVFKTAIKAERTARATAEIARKLRAITDQLNADFRGIRYEGEMAFAWVPSEIKEDVPDDGTDELVVTGYERFDQMMFFTDNNVNMHASYNDNPTVRGNIARVHYTLAYNKEGESPYQQDKSKRVLARVQHIYTPPANDPTVAYFPELYQDPFDYEVYQFGEDYFEYDNTTMFEWLNMSDYIREQVYSSILDLYVDFDKDGKIGPLPIPNPSFPDEAGTWQLRGQTADPSDPSTLHKVLCEGVGEFTIQDWYWDMRIDPDTSEIIGWRWWPEIDRDSDGICTDIDTDFFLNGDLVNTDIAPSHFHDGDDSFFNYFGRAFKFTFTLYDSYGIFPEGKTFTHIIYLDSMNGSD